MKVFKRHPLSKETELKISQSRTGQKLSEETKRKISLAVRGQPYLKNRLGTKQTQETIEKIRLGNKGKIVPQSVREQIRNTLTGHPVSAESKLKNRLKHLGKRQSEETKMKRSENLKRYYLNHPSFNLGRHLSEEHKQKIHNSLKGKVPKVNYLFTHQLTSIEKKIQDSLDEAGIRYSSQKSLLNGMTQADIFIGPNICIYADGCYWHGCEKCINRNRFTAKHREQILKDNLISMKLEKEGYVVLRFWEHEINQNVSPCIQKIIEKLPAENSGVL